MSQFDAATFMSEPSEDTFAALKKDELISLAKHLKLEVKTAMRKHQIQNIVLKHLVSEGIFKETVLEKYEVPKLGLSELDYKLELQKMEMRERREEKERQERLEEKERQERLQEKERQERLEEKERQERLEKEKMELQHELEMKKLEVQLKLGSDPCVEKSSAKFDVTKHIKFVPPFQQADVDKYFLHFEKVAGNLKWPKEYWVMLLQSVLVGKAREIYIQLSVEQATSYDTVKELILKGYELVPEAYRQKFRSCEKLGYQTYVEFARSKEQLFDRWCHSQKVDKDHDKLRQLILIEEFKRCIHSDVRTFVDEQKAETLEDAARLADEFSLCHKVTFVEKPKRPYPQPGQDPPPLLPHRPGNHRNRQSEESRQKQNPGNSSANRSNFSWSRQDKVTSGKPFKPLTCFYCRKDGHVLSNCPEKLKMSRQYNAESKPTGFIATSLSLPDAGEDMPPNCSDVKTKSSLISEVSAPPKPVMDVFEPFIHQGSVSLSSDMSDSKQIKILRDTGASQSLLLSNTLLFSEESSVGASVLIRGINCSEYSPVPLHTVYLKSSLVTGPVKVGIQPSLPFEGVHFILGNDLAGDKVVVNAIVTEKPCLVEFPDPVEKEIPGLYPACVVTRAMSKKKENSEDVITLAETVIGQVLEGEPPKISGSEPVEVIAEGSLSDEADKMSTSQLIAEQHKDPELSNLFLRVVDENEVSQNPVCLFTKNGVLMRKWRPPDVSVEDEWAVKHQIVIPKSYRQEILSMAHETPLAGHMGINKTCQKILNHFYWPSLRKDVVEFCKSCHACQMVGKPNQSIPKAPLQPIPAVQEPFSRIIVDCVGPLPKTRSGNQYLLTIMCASTRFPEAIPLRNIKAKTIVKALTKFFTLVGLPSSIQSDQGSNFMSGVFQQVMHELGITQYKSSAYHPQSQGALERWHQTLKTMMRIYCFETEKDWDEGIHLLLFAARESVQESLGFSPFELVFGHTVRGPLKLLKEKLLQSSNNESINLLQYVSDFRTKLFRACELARANLSSSQKSMKNKYDVDAVERSFKPGQKVLALLPVPGNPLNARFFGPYVIQKKLSNLNYLVVTPDRRKQTQLCHVNMLKPYVERSTDVVLQPASVNVVVSESKVELDSELSGNSFSPTDTTRLTNTDVLRNLDSKLSHLSESQRQDLEKLLLEFKHLFPDVPTRTDQIYHDVDVGNAEPVKQHPYRLNPSKQKYLKEEIKYLLENDFIEPSNSSWSSPCILVPKPDGSYRMCTDYRKVNCVTKTDTFPIPRMDDCIDKVGKARYVTKFDLLKGFWQVPLTDRAKEISAFVTPDGLFQYKVMPFGMKNSPASFQRLINKVIADLEGCEAYIDDVIIYSDTWEEHLRIIREFFKRLSRAMLTINLSKSEFGQAQVTYLGHVVGQGEVKPVSAKVEAIAKFPQPVSKKQLMRFLGMAGYYRRFCPNFAAVAEPLTQLLSKRVKFIWSERCDKAFEELKAMLQSAPVLAAPDFRSPFKLAVDASDVAAGAVLLQEDDEGVEHPVCYFSKKFNKSQRNYSTIEKECLALVLALQQFEVYVSSSGLPIVVYSDHNPLVFIHKMKNKNQRLLRWSLMLQEYVLEIRHIKGKDNVIADCLSRV